MKVKDAKVSIGGLLRCCHETIEKLDPEREFQEGETLDCEFEPPGNKAIIFENGVFRWNEKDSEERFELWKMLKGNEDCG